MAGVRAGAHRCGPLRPTWARWWLAKVVPENEVVTARHPHVARIRCSNDAHRHGKHSHVRIEDEIKRRCGGAGL